MGVSRRQFLKTSTALGLTLLWFKRAWAQNVQISIACEKRLGDAAQIGDMLGMGGLLYYISEIADDPMVLAFKNIGVKHLTFETMQNDTPPDRWVNVTRDTNNIPQVDFTDYDRYLQSYLTNLGVQPFVYVGDVPRILSSQPDLELGIFSTSMPRDLVEWENFAASIARHNVENLGLRGLTYAAPGEPDFPGNWLYAPDDDPSTQLFNHIALYAATYRGIKSVDPEAKVGAPGTMNWQRTAYTPDVPFVLSDWIASLAQYNAASGDQAVGLDYIAWQDHGWSSDRLSDGADAVAGFLSQNGFDPALPKMLAGSQWGAWSSDYLNDQLLPHQRASHVLYNLIREFKDPRQRKFSRAYYYFFMYSPGWYPVDWADQPYFKRVSAVNIRSDNTLEYTPIYAAFQMAQAMMQGEIIETTAPDGLEVMAVRDDVEGEIILTINNHSATWLTADITIFDYPYGGAAVSRGISWLDEVNGNDGLGLQWQVIDEVPISEGKVFFPINLNPYGSVQVGLYRVQ